MYRVKSGRLQGPHANGLDRGGGANDFACTATNALIVDYGIGIVLRLVPHDFNRIIGTGELARVAFLLAEGGKADVGIDERFSDDVFVFLLERERGQRAGGAN